MNVRLLLALVVAVVGACLNPGPAAAAPQRRRSSRPLAIGSCAARPSSRSKAAPCWSASTYVSLTRVLPSHRHRDADRRRDPDE
jgi:hypothetical protein